MWICPTCHARVPEECSCLNRKAAAAKAAYVDAQERERLRDYFAGLAMQALVEQDGIDWFSRVAGSAYRMADAMLAEREK